jgi:HKD family nuclease
MFSYFARVNSRRFVVPSVSPPPTRIAHNPRGTPNIGEIFLACLADSQWETCRIAVAFARAAGTHLIRDALAGFAGRGALEIVVGLDEQGTSKDALEELAAAVLPRGQLLCAHNPAGYPFNPTFHPKIFLFRNASKALAIVGSVNFTRGGLFENYEAALVHEMDLRNPSEAQQLAEIEAMLDGWISGNQSIAQPFTTALMDQLVVRGIIQTEQEIAQKMARVAGGRPRAPRQPSANPFRAVQEPRHAAPRRRATRSRPPPGAAISGGATAPVAQIASPTYVQTLHTTDVGVGQTNPGTQARSPEIFIPKEALDLRRGFWGWRAAFTNNPTKPHLASRRIRVLLNGREGPATLMVNNNKKDLRLRSAAIRRASKVGDILVLAQAPPGSQYEFGATIVPKGSPLHATWLARCDHRVAGRSQKRWGFA